MTNLTIDCRHPEQAISHAAAAHVIAAAVRVGHTVTLAAGPRRATFALDHDRIKVSVERPEGLDDHDPVPWARRLATTATSLLQQPRIANPRSARACG